MVRYKNEDHAQVASQLDAEMARMGMVDDGSGNYVPAPKGQEPQRIPVSNESTYANQEPISQVTPVFTPQPTPQPQTHNWEKREADARDAQRQLSQERERVLEERQMLARERSEAMNTLQALQEQRTALVSQAASVPVVQTQVLSQQFREEYPDIAEAITQAFSANQQEIQSLKQERRQESDAVAIEQEKTRRRLFLDEVKREHRDYESIIGSEHFQQWSATQNRSTRLVLEETFALGYEPSDLAEVLTRYKRAFTPAHSPSQVPNELRSIDPQNRSMDQNSEPSDPNNFVFSKAEMADPTLIDRWMMHSNHRRNRPAAMNAFEAAWERSVAFHNTNR